MKKVIERKLYDTETATLIAEWENTHDTRDFTYINEALYRTPSGTYFLVGAGGPDTRYAERHGNLTSGSREWFLFTRVEALEWAERVGATTCILEHFGDLVEVG